MVQYGNVGMLVCSFVPGRKQTNACCLLHSCTLPGWQSLWIKKQWNKNCLWVEWGYYFSKVVTPLKLDIFILQPLLITYFNYHSQNFHSSFLFICQCECQSLYSWNNFKRKSDVWLHTLQWFQCNRCNAAIWFKDTKDFNQCWNCIVIEASEFIAIKNYESLLTAIVAVAHIVLLKK
jgi:hypothetical protein